MSKDNLKWCVNVAKDLFDQAPWMSWSELFDDLQAAYNSTISPADRRRIKQALSNQDYY
jgi:hypothetical protein